MFILGFCFLPLPARTCWIEGEKDAQQEWVLSGPAAASL
jgi:hypothetical protein